VQTHGNCKKHCKTRKTGQLTKNTASGFRDLAINRNVHIEPGLVKTSGFFRKKIGF